MIGGPTHYGHGTDANPREFGILEYPLKECSVESVISHFFSISHNPCRQVPSLRAVPSSEMEPAFHSHRQRKWHRSICLDEADNRLGGGASIRCLCDAGEPSRHLPTRAAPTPFARRCAGRAGELTLGCRATGHVPKSQWCRRQRQARPGSRTTFQVSRQRVFFARKFSLLSTAQKFLPLRGADKVAPCGAGNFLSGAARAKKRLEIMAELNQRGSLRCFRKSRCAKQGLRSNVRTEI